jgi:IS5 family transposase
LEEFARLPDESTILRFRHRLEKHKLAEQILVPVNELLTQRGLRLKAGTAVDAKSGLVHTVRGTSGHVSDIA